MIPFGGHIIGANNRHDNVLGAALYVSAAGVDDPTAIRYRHGRPLSGHVIAAGVEWQPGTHFLHDACVAIIVSPTNEITYSLPAEYHGTTFWAQVRSHASGLENETLWRPQRITLDGGGDGGSASTIDGTAIVLAVEKRDGGGLRVRFRYLSAETGLTPDTFTLSRTAGPTSPSDVSTSYQIGARDYTLDVESLTDAGAYTFALKATSGAAESTLTTIDFTADASGPGAVQNLTAGAC